MFEPLNFEALNMYNGTRSVAGKVENDFTTSYYMRSLYQRVYSGFKLVCPNTWNKRYFKNVLYGLGFIGIVKTEKYGVIPQICGFGGELDIFLAPTKMMVKQPLVDFDGTIGVDCELIMLTPDYRGIWDIVEHYASRLAVATTSLDVSLINTRTPFMAAAKNKSAAETLKVIAEKISAGENLIVFDKNLKSDDFDHDDPIWTLTQNMKENYITDKLLADIQTILEDFDREIGIAAMGEKKERMITDEAEAAKADACARSECWFDCLTETFDRANRLFPDINIGFSMKYGGDMYYYEKGGVVNEYDG